MNKDEELANYLYNELQSDVSGLRISNEYHGRKSYAIIFKACNFKYSVYVRIIKGDCWRIPKPAINEELVNVICFKKNSDSFRFKNIISWDKREEILDWIRNLIKSDFNPKNLNYWIETENTKDNLVNTCASIGYDTGKILQIPMVFRRFGIDSSVVEVELPSFKLRDNWKSSIIKSYLDFIITSGGEKYFMLRREKDESSGLILDDIGNNDYNPISEITDITGSSIDLKKILINSINKTLSDIPDIYNTPYVLKQFENYLKKYNFV